MAKKKLPRVTGFGGLFFKAKDSESLGAWYRDRLGLAIEEWGGCVFPWRDETDPKKKGQTVWSIFDAKSPYFRPSRKGFMMNFRVDDLDRVLAELEAEGVKISPASEESEFGKFGWVMDPEGNKIELWQPPAPPKPEKTPKAKKSKSDKAKQKKTKKKKKSKK
ncbi:MAG: glyoxalase/bleomycin resistance/dioxygenase family protein [Synoicihabitans sp.]